MKNLLKTSATAWSSDIIFSDTISPWASILSVKKGFTVFQKVLLAVMSLVLIILKKFFFSFLIKLT